MEGFCLVLVKRWVAYTHFGAKNAHEKQIPEIFKQKQNHKHNRVGFRRISFLISINETNQPFCCFLDCIYIQRLNIPPPSSPKPPIRSTAGAHKPHSSHVKGRFAETLLHICLSVKNLNQFMFKLMVTCLVFIKHMFNVYISNTLGF